VVHDGIDVKEQLFGFVDVPFEKTSLDINDQQATLV